MEKNYKNQITENGLLFIDNLPFDKKNKQKFNIDITLQIYKTSKYNYSKHNIYSISLMDYFHKYNGFFILFDENSSPKIGDIIKIKTITFIKLDSAKKIILITNYEIIENNVKLINQPNEIKLLEMRSDKKDLDKEKILIQTNDNTTKVKKLFNNDLKLNKSYENSKKENSFLPSVEKNQSLLNKNNNKSTNNLINSTINKKEEEYSLFSSLTSFSKKKTILAKCIKKYSIKHYNSRTNGLPGKLFSVILSDKEGFEMEGCCFNDSVNILYDKFQEGKIYEIKEFNVKINDKKFLCPNVDYKLFFERNTIIKEIKQIEEFKEIKNNFVKFNKLEEINIENLINIFGYIINISDIISINTKFGERKIRRIIIGDETGYKVELTLWNKLAKINIPIKHFITAKRIKISQYNTIKKLGTINASEIIIDDKNCIKEQLEIEKKLKNKNFSFKFNKDNFSDFFNDYYIYFIDELLKHFEENSDEKELYKVKCYVKNLNHSDKNYYIGCNLCRKRIIISDKEYYFCEFCNNIFKQPTYFYSLNITICDCSMDYKIIMFDDLGKNFIGYSVEEYKKLIENKDLNKLKEIDKKMLYQEFYFILKIKSNVINNNQKIDFRVIKFEKVDEKKESESIISLLNKLNDHTNENITKNK